MDYVILVLLVLVGIVMFLIYQKVNLKNENTKLSDEIGVERQVKEGINAIQSKQDNLLQELKQRL